MRRDSVVAATSPRSIGPAAQARAAGLGGLPEAEAMEAALALARERLIESANGGRGAAHRRRATAAVADATPGDARAAASFASLRVATRGDERIFLAAFVSQARAAGLAHLPEFLAALTKLAKIEERFENNRQRAFAPKFAALAAAKGLSPHALGEELKQERRRLFEDVRATVRDVETAWRNFFRLRREGAAVAGRHSDPATSTRRPRDVDAFASRRRVVDPRRRCVRRRGRDPALRSPPRRRAAA